MNHLSAKTLFHKDDPETSREAAEKMVESGKLSRQEEYVHENIKLYLYAYGKKDFTAKDLSIWGKWLNYYVVQRRLSGLYRKGKIERTGAKREGCCVWRLIKER